MSQHFLLSSKARTLSIMNIVKMSDMEAFDMFKAIRWSETNGDVVCPCCGSIKKPYFLKTRMQFMISKNSSTCYTKSIKTLFTSKLHSSF